MVSGSCKISKRKVQRQNQLGIGSYKVHLSEQPFLRDRSERNWSRNCSLGSQEAAVHWLGCIFCYKTMWSGTSDEKVNKMTVLAGPWVEEDGKGR